MSWLRQHWDGARIVAVTRVSLGPKGYLATISGTNGELRPHDANHHFTSRYLAFEAADALARHRGGHSCTDACTGWVETADGRVSPS